jgi:hypothetical protein
MAARKEETDKVADVKVAGGKNAPGENEKASASKERHETDLAVNASDAVERARQEREDQVQASVESAAERATSQPARGPDGVIEAHLMDAARKAEDTKQTDLAREAADLGNGYRVRTDALEPVPPVDVYAGRRKFDVGGQPVEDPELIAKSRANFEAEQKKAAKEG